jgi:hypothetical protein
MSFRDFSIPPGAVAPKNCSGLGVGSHPSSGYTTTTGATLGSVSQNLLSPPVAVYPQEEYDPSDSSQEDFLEVSPSSNVAVNPICVTQGYQSGTFQNNVIVSNDNDSNNDNTIFKKIPKPKTTNFAPKKNNVKEKKIHPDRQKHVDALVLIDPRELAADIEACSLSIEKKKSEITAEKNRLSEMKAAQKIQEKGPPKAARIILKDLNPNELANVFVKYQKMSVRPYPMIVTLAVGRGPYTKQMAHLFPHDGYAHLDPGVVFTENERKILEKFRVKIIHPGSTVSPFSAPILSDTSSQ